jgi:uncharacterized protein YndB with AHSA1/START domain
MNRTIQPAPVRRSVTVKAPPERAFEVFTGKIGAWWPKTHHIGAVDPETIIVEPRAGGRWFERAPDGTECDLGKVLAWDPPNRLVLAWQLTHEWKYDPGLVTEVEVQFFAEADGSTRVELEHRDLERFGEHAERVAAAIGAPGGWTAVLEAYAQAASR